METKQISLVGYGAMGQRIAAAIEAREGWELCGAIDPLHTPQCHASLEELPQVPHLIIDFSHPANLAMVCDYVQRHKVPCVIATTGYTPAQEAMCQELAAYAPVVRTQNTSLGINVMQQILKVITPVLTDAFDIEIIEKHHNKKLDAPSGTALMIADAVKDIVTETRGKEAEYTFERASKREQRKPQEIGISSIRGGTIVGEHEIMFAGKDEILSISHSAASREVFAVGAIRAALFMKDRPAGFYDMGSMIG